MDVETLQIEDKTYIIVDKIVEDETYFYLSNLDNSNDILVRKLDKENSDYIIPLTDDAEYNKAMLIYLNKQMQSM